MTTRQAIDRGLGLYVCWDRRLVLRVSAGQFRLWGDHAEEGGRSWVSGAGWRRLSDEAVADLELVGKDADWRVFE